VSRRRGEIRADIVAYKEKKRERENWRIPRRSLAKAGKTLGLPFAVVQKRGGVT